jgi:hypothetical protein
VQPSDPHVNSDTNVGDMLDMYFNSTDTGSATMAYGNPYAGWYGQGSLGYGYAKDVKLAASKQPYYMYVGYNAGYPDVTTLSAGPLRPEITAIQTPLINGKDLHAPQNGVGATPTISWTAPVTGTPTLYQVRIYRLTLDANQATQAQVVAYLKTKQTSVTVPPGALTVGESYIAVLTAVKEEITEVTEELGSVRLPYISMDSLSEIFVP